MNEPVSTSASPVEPARPGGQLAAARESCGLGVADVARQLKLSPWQVEALEAGDYGRLPGAVFVRGFIRNYARLVRLDPASLLASAEQQSPRAPPPPPSVNIPFPVGSEPGWQRYAIVALVVLVPVVIFETYRDDAPEVTVKSRPVILPQPRVVAEEKGAETGAEPQVPAPDDAVATPARTDQPAAKAEEAAAEKPAISANTAADEHKPGEHLVKLTFNRESWVEIRDRRGRKIFARLNPAGTEQEVSGLPPLSLVVGNAAGVRVVHNDQPVDLAPHIKVDVARLTLE